MQDKFLISRTAAGKDLPLPQYMTPYAAGMDLYANVEKEMRVGPGESALVPSGIRISLPPGYEAQIRPRSGLALKHSVTLLNTPGTIDADYRGEIKVILINHGKAPFNINRGDRIAQMVIARVETPRFQEVALLDETVRGEGGFGHTGSAMKSE